ncbi:MAG: DNA protecting protein DprA [Bacteroidales bacterium 45-6]|nr:MAG: DNA protecting protein DprA [Bacteroidales bacterium 45-6]
MHEHSRLTYRIALTKIPGVGDIIARNLLRGMGDEAAIFTESRKALLAAGISARIIEEIKRPALLEEAKREAEFVEKNKITPIFISGKEYPSRLIDCVDAPVLLYYKGNADLNSKKIISIVGTRKATSYATDFCETFLRELSSLFPDVIIASGLAYGIDIHAHRTSLKLGLSTVGVLAHGLDRFYPSVHQRTALEMIGQGGLLTEFPSGTNPDKHNFVRRNRIVAGMADAVIVLESAEKGGSLITAEIASSYYKDVFALPGRATDLQSAGCNNLIVNNKAALLQSAESFVRQMGWGNTASKASSAKPPIQRELLLDLTHEERAVYDALYSEEMQVNLLAVRANIPLSKLFYTLLDMEMKGIIKPLPGGVYRVV